MFLDNELELETLDREFDRDSRDAFIFNPELEYVSAGKPITARRTQFSPRSQMIDGPRITIVPLLVIDRFSLNQFALLSHHIPLIARTAHQVIASWRGNKPVREIRVIGHADNTGQAPYNQQLGLRRALAVKAGLSATLQRLNPEIMSRVRILASSFGARWPAFHKSNTTPGGPARNRRVEIFLVSPLGVSPLASVPRARSRRSPVAFESESPSSTRNKFEEALGNQDWVVAIENLNALNMSEMLQSIDAVNPHQFHELWMRRAAVAKEMDEKKKAPVNMPRIEYARSVVLNRVLPDIIPGDLKSTNQDIVAADFIAGKLAKVRPGSNADRAANISLILLECNYYGINDKSHLAYVLASAQHESIMGQRMTEIWGPTPDQLGYEGKNGNKDRGDGFKYRGRGFVQITFRANYKKYEAILATRGIKVNLETSPEMATEPFIAAIIISHGMSQGGFTTSRLSDFGTDGKYNFVRARRIVNADVAKNGQLIAGIAQRFRKAMDR